MNWNQTGMPSVLVSQLGQKREIAEFRSVLKDAQDQIMHPADAEAMARELVESGGREFVDMVRELTTALANAKRELEEANRRYERLIADLKQRGVRILDNPGPRRLKPERKPEVPSAEIPSVNAKPSDDGLAEWEEWNRRFQALLG